MRGDSRVPLAGRRDWWGRQGDLLPLLAMVLVFSARPCLGEKAHFDAGPLAGIDGLLDELPTGPARNPVVCHIFTKHPDTIRAALKKRQTGDCLDYSEKIARIARQQSGLPCITIHYAQLSGQGLDDTGIKAIIVTALDRRISPEYTEALLGTIRKTSVPMIGFCGGHHLIGLAHGSKLGPLRKLAPGEEDPNPKYHPGQFKEWGFLPVRVLKRDPLFEGLGDEIVVREMHAFQLLELGPDLENLATTDECHVQAFRHKTRPAFGTQFHAENFDAEHPDGQVLLRNFFHIAGLNGGVP